MIEDNPGDARLIREALAQADGKVCLSWADDLAAGLDHLQHSETDAVLLDLSLPDSCGLDTFERVHTKAPRVPIVMLSGHNDQDLAVEAVRCGAQDYLVKGQVEGHGLVRALRYAIERKHVEEKLQELYEAERRLRQEREAEINKRMEYTRALVHELKTPLTSVMASSELLMSELPPGPLLRLATNLNRASCNLSTRINELLDLARGELGMLRLAYKPIDLLTMLAGVVEEMTSAASARKHTLLIDLPDQLPSLYGDEERLHQVLLNLMDNALKYTPEGGMITLKAALTNEQVVIGVEDTGPGISVEEQQHLFNPYQRLERDRDRLNGLGLGLSLCKMLVELHGGMIWVDSVKGRGSKFNFSIPTAPPQIPTQVGTYHEVANG